MVAKAGLLVALVAAMAFSGCIAENGSNGQKVSDGGSGGDAFNFAGNGQYTGEIESGELDCDGDGRLSISVNGQGTLTLTITDGAGSQVGSWDFSGQGQGVSDEALDGTPGTWTVVLDAQSSGFPFSGGYQGQYSGRVSC